jgi:hypothetical protein
MRRTPRIPEAPAHLPVLRRGSHRRSSGAAWLMEYVSVLTGAVQRFASLHPPALAELGRRVSSAPGG